jgi:cytochrome c oxidase assembly protein subunit 15
MRLPRLSPTAYRRLVLVALFPLGAIIVTGGAVRLTGSGLGCPDWPQCNGSQLVAQASFHPMIEFANRLFTGAVSVAVAVAVLGALVRERRRRDLTWLSVGLVAGVIGQIVLGGLSVLYHLWPPLVMGHFLVSMAIVWNGVVLHGRASWPDPPPEDPDGQLPPDRRSGGPGRDRLVPLVDDRVRWLGRLLVALTGVVVVAGTVVTGTGPHGGDEHVKRLPLLLPDVARVHGVLVEAFTVAVLVTIVLLWRQGAPAAVLRRAEVVLAVAVAQSVVGYVQYFTGVPPLLVGVHIAGAVTLWVAVLRFHLGLWNAERGQVPLPASPRRQDLALAQAGATTSRISSP